MSNEPPIGAARPSALDANDAERAILGTLLVYADRAFRRIGGIVSAKDFSRPQYRVLYHHLWKLWSAGAPIDPTSFRHAVVADDRAMAHFGNDTSAPLALAATLMDESLSEFDNYEHHARIVAEAARRRDVAEKAQRLLTSVSDPTKPLVESVQDAFSSLLPVAANLRTGGFKKIDPMAAITSIEERGRNPDFSIRTGFRAIDDVFHGFRRKELVIVGGSAKSGKTAWTLNVARQVAYNGHGVAFVSCEMDRDALTERLLNADALVSVGATSGGRLSPEETVRIAEAGGRLSRLPFEIDDAALPSIDDVCYRVLELKARMPSLALVVVDFLQLVQPDRANEPEAIALKRTSYRLKALAKEADVLVWAPTQLNYKQIDGDAREPELRDLQGSSGMAQAADAVFLVWQSATGDGIFRQQERQFHVKCDASRRTPKFGVQFSWDGRYMRVVEAEQRRSDTFVDRPMFGDRSAFDGDEALEGE